MTARDLMRHPTVTPTATIMAHPLWPGSMESMDHQYGGIRRDLQVERIQARLRCTDLTPRERTWCALWCDLLGIKP